MLPEELRNAIYVVAGPKVETMHDNDPERKSVIAVCHQICAEVTPMFHNSDIFELKLRFLSTFGMIAS